MTAPLAKTNLTHNGGFSVLELLIVVTMITVLTGYAYLHIDRARQEMTRENAAHQLTGNLEKARVDSVRRRPTTVNQMASVSMINATVYSVTIDQDGDGTLDAPRVFTLPSDASLQFDLPYPRTIYFNWRGRTVDNTGAIANPSFINIRSPSYGSTRIDLTSAGQPTLDGPPASDPVLNSTAPTPTFRSHTQVP